MFDPHPELEALKTTEVFLASEKAALLADLTAAETSGNAQIEHAIRQQLTAVAEALNANQHAQTAFSNNALQLRAPSCGGGAQTLKYILSVRRGARCCGLRKDVYECAQWHGAFDEEVTCSQHPITPDADMLVTLYFRGEAALLSCRAAIFEKIRVHGLEEPSEATEITNHVCQKRTRTTNMHKATSPPDPWPWRSDDDDIDDDKPWSVSTSECHATLTIEDTQRETLCDFAHYAVGGDKALWVHVKAKNTCRGEAEKASSANRLVMNWHLRSMYDETLTNDGTVPTTDSVPRRGRN